jgi:hypothetical protein
MLLVFLILLFVLLVIRRNLLLVLLLLEILGFVLIYFVSFQFSLYSRSDYIVLMVFSILVIEGVIALCGLIRLVRFRGSDYLSSRSLLKV